MTKDERVRVDGSGGVKFVHLSHESGTKAQVCLLGATITSFESHELGELLYLSPKAEYAEGKAIRGGIPLVFPQFGPGVLPSHGFARNRIWSVEETFVGAGGEPSVRLTFTSNEATREVWPFDFQLTLQVILSDVLSTTFSVANVGNEPFQFQHALHTYFQVEDIHAVQLPGLSGLRFLDNTKNREAGTEDRDTITFDGEIDRIYESSPKELALLDKKAERQIVVNKEKMQDSVVWNPWTEKAKSLKDLPDDGYRQFLCVESGNIVKSIDLAPGETFECVQKLSARKAA